MTDTQRYSSMTIPRESVVYLQAKSINGFFLASWIDVFANGSRLDLMTFASVTGGWASLRHQGDCVHVTVIWGIGKRHLTIA